MSICSSDICQLLTFPIWKSTDRSDCEGWWYPHVNPLAAAESAFYIRKGRAPQKNMDAPVLTQDAPSDAAFLFRSTL